MPNKVNGLMLIGLLLIVIGSILIAIHTWHLIPLMWGSLKWYDLVLYIGGLIVYYVGMYYANKKG